MLRDIIVSLLTSTIVMGFAVLAVKAWLEGRVKHEFDVQLENQRQEHKADLERLKAELKIGTDAANHISDRRLAIYPSVVEVVYRIRNLARGVIETDQASDALADELAARMRELEDAVFKYRIDFERDGVFVEIHSYKNRTKIFCRTVDDLRYSHRQGTPAQTAELMKLLRDLYSEIDVQHKPMLELLAQSTGADVGTQTGPTRSQGLSKPV